MNAHGKFTELAEAGFTPEQVGAWGAITKYLLARAGLSDDEIYGIFLGVPAETKWPGETPAWPFESPAPDWWI